MYKRYVFILIIIKMFLTTPPTSPRTFTAPGAPTKPQNPEPLIYSECLESRKLF